MLQVRELWRVSSRSNLVSQLPDKYVLHAELPKEPVREQPTKGRFVVSGECILRSAIPLRPP